ncbi:MAG: hypothetical protein B6U76_08330 [Desulfurococcales archaeon ex4484_217_2]|nr:MAG: hypothetical protein B6U76_08330 [Desulfurococcales archaeon ex4484_217_2]
MIRKACCEDADEILEVIVKTNRAFFSKIIPKKYFKDPILTREELLKEMENIEFYIYELEGKIVGVSGLTMENKETGIVRWVYVLPKYQRRGIGAALLRHVENIAKRRGIRKLKLRTSEKAYWAISFYRKLGYKIVSKIKVPWGYDVIFAKEL